MAQVFLGMSGGVDSSAAAVLLQEQGYAVSGLHLSLLSGLPLPADRLPDDGSDARAVASLLGLPFYDMDLSPEFRATVIDYFIREYEAGRTPNPCVFCNRRIKFGAMWDAARKLGADWAYRWLSVCRPTFRWLRRRSILWHTPTIRELARVWPEWILRCLRTKSRIYTSDLGRRLFPEQVFSEQWSPTTTMTVSRSRAVTIGLRSVCGMNSDFADIW